ncbi:hypothetical protein T15_1395 [Streptococcus suis T15]|uniref:Uncharacterized protein n=1 Tax=Streptococcus suis (strain GZ1) TaxID=423211 RepID=D5AGS4_STRGZ|nr:hypothetical protein SSGZ1_0577 [Streptococcus suis GZ1]AGZ23485.1 hypothetical protein T15_1395 [Streptococcus suis T15]
MLNATTDFGNMSINDLISLSQRFISKSTTNRVVATTFWY